MLTCRLPYSVDSAVSFSPWMDRDGAVLLDSGSPHTEAGRYDIFSYEPHTQLITEGSMTKVKRIGEDDLFFDGDPFNILRRFLGERETHQSRLPFVGGAIGYFAYDLSQSIENIHDPRVNEDALPSMMVGIYDWAVIVDHVARETWLVAAMRHAGTKDLWQVLIHQFSQSTPPTRITQEFRVTSLVESNMSKHQYRDAFNRIQHYIKDGDCYQINFAQRFLAHCEGQAWTLYLQLRKVNPAPFSAYMNCGYLQVLSSSPERFILLKGGHVQTKPIKGTRPRSSDPVSDALLAEHLVNSEKDRSENLMIVDLLRNDLGKDCKPGSIHVPELFRLESYASVHHMVSTVTGELRPDRDALHLLRNSFPGGSITGAPKIRAMEIIAELETHPRGIYCGAIGYIGHDGNMDTNIAIRTLVRHRDTLQCWAGGGIVADSVSDHEYDECFHKASPLLEVMNSFRAVTA